MPTKPDRQVALIAGAGPAGLTAALELLRRSNVLPIVVEADTQVGGISKTINYRGNRMDLGGHRFFSKSDWVMRWWQSILPIAQGELQAGIATRLAYQGRSLEFTPTQLESSSSDAVMLVRQRLSRIFYRGRFFNYPLKLDSQTLRNIGLNEALQIGLSYAHARLSPVQPEVTLQDFFVNRFGDRLYRTFFKDYTEKVWGVPCEEISAEWGAQRIKGLSVTKAITHAVRQQFRSTQDSPHKDTETSLIEHFLYPKLGPGQMWEEVARRVVAEGGRILLRHRLVGIEKKAAQITAVNIRDETTGSVERIACDHLISTMPVRELVSLLSPSDGEVAQIAAHLPYRDFMTVGLLVRKMKGGSPRKNAMPPDNWIYIQEPGVKLGRLQIFNNWSPAMVADPELIWLGLEYFCREGDDQWSMKDAEFIEFAARELETIGMIDRKDVIDGHLVRVAKAYPAYFGEYQQFDAVRRFIDGIGNLYPVGRNGMHRYNNQDHSMLSANAAVDAIIDPGRGKQAIWAINAEDEYHEGRT